MLQSFEDMKVIIAMRIINFLVGIYMSIPWVIHISEGVMFYNLTNQNMDNSAASGTRLPENPTRPATILGYPQYPKPDFFGLSITRPANQLPAGTRNQDKSENFEYF